MRNYLVIRNNGGKPEDATVLRQLKSGRYLVRTSSGIIEEDGSNLFDFIKRGGWDTIEEAIDDMEGYNFRIMTKAESEDTQEYNEGPDGFESLDGEYFWGGWF